MSSKNICALGLKSMCNYCDFISKNPPRKNEVQTFRLTPTVGKYYEYVLATRSVVAPINCQTNDYERHIYYTTYQYTYVGRFVSGHSQGYGDGGTYYEIYDDNGTERRIDYDYYGMTCLREVPCRVTTPTPISTSETKQSNI
jgi:hypothetical protein